MIVGLVLKLYLEDSDILSQLRVADPLSDDINNARVVHAPTLFF